MGQHINKPSGGRGENNGGGIAMLNQKQGQDKRFWMSFLVYRI